MELLKQPLEQPMSQHAQVITLCAATGKLFLDVPVAQLKEFQGKLLAWMDEKYPQIGAEIDQTGKLNEALIEKILAAVREYKQQVVS